MTVANRSRTFLKAQVVGTADEANEIDSQLTRDERAHYHLLAMALFAGMVGHTLGDEPSREDITRFIEEMRLEYRDAEPKINFFAVEGMLRALYGEEDLLDDIAPKDRYLAQMPVIYKIAGQSTEVRDRIDDFLSDAETLADHWQGA